MSRRTTFSWRRKRQWRCALAILLMPAASGAVTDAAGAAARICEQQIAEAERRLGIPDGLLLAMGAVESVRGRRIWPWSLNLGGKGLWFDDREAALASLRAAIRSGRRNIDVGCLQINMQWAARGLSPDEAIDPATNVVTAARHLVALHAETGSWTKAVAAYHSRRPSRARAYVCKVFVPFSAYREGTARTHAACKDR